MLQNYFTFLCFVLWIGKEKNLTIRCCPESKINKIDCLDNLKQQGWSKGEEIKIFLKEFGFKIILGNDQWIVIFNIFKKEKLKQIKDTSICIHRLKTLTLIQNAIFMISKIDFGNSDIENLIINSNISSDCLLKEKINRLKENSNSFKNIKGLLIECDDISNFCLPDEHTLIDFEVHGAFSIVLSREDTSHFCKICIKTIQRMKLVNNAVFLLFKMCFKESFLNEFILIVNTEIVYSNFMRCLIENEQLDLGNINNDVTIENCFWANNIFKSIVYDQQVDDFYSSLSGKNKKTRHTCVVYADLF